MSAQQRTTPLPSVVARRSAAKRSTRTSLIQERWRQFRPLLRLLSYVRGQRRWAVLTLFFGVIGFLLSFVYPWIIGNVVDLVLGASQLTAAQRKTRLIELSVLALGTAIMHAVVVYGRGHYNVRLGDAIITSLRRELFEHLQKLSMHFYTRERAGGILARVLNDVREATSIIYMGVFVAGMDAVQLAIAVVLLSAISWKLTLACAGLFPLYALVFRAMNPRVRRASERVHGHLSFIAANMNEQLHGQALVKTYTAEEREARRFAADVLHHHDLVVAQSHEGHLVASSGEVLVHLGTTIVVGYGGYLALHGEMTAGMMTRFLGYVIIMYGPVRRFAELNITYQSSLSAIRRVFRILEIEPAIQEKPTARKDPPRLGAVRFEDVRFCYADDSDESRARLDDDDARRSRATAPDGSPWVLDGITLECSPGERIAIVGPSGAGKTTLVSLLPRLYDATLGRVLVDGVDVRDYKLSALRSAMAIVQQDSFVFTGSIRDNIAYGKPDATDDEIVAAAKAANAHEFIERMPKGYDTRLGERGVNLSGGQRQRISIARALLKDPRILILDEATSALDTESERLVQSALDRLMRGRTCFIIAHRLSTIRNADRIIVLDAGRIVEAGTSDELMALDGLYARLARAQTIAKERLRTSIGL